VALGMAIALIVVSLYFFTISLSLINPPQGMKPNVTASLLSALFGFSLLSAGVTIFRTAIVSHVAEEKTS